MKDKQTTTPTQAKNKTRRKVRQPFFVNFGGRDVQGQNNMSDRANPYNHITGKYDTNGESPNLVTSGSILFRGSDNKSPQKDIELGKRSITHRRIAESLARLVRGGGFIFTPKKDIDLEDADQQEIVELELMEVEQWMENGLALSLDNIANGMVYFDLANLTVVQSRPRFSDRTRTVTANADSFVSYRSEQMRYTVPEMNEKGVSVVKKHLFHTDWLFNPDSSCDDDYSTPTIVPIEDYIRKGYEKSNYIRGNTKVGYSISTKDDDSPAMKRFLSWSITTGDKIFDGAYPLPSWKTNSSINDIQNEFEASCIRTDYLKNGLHIFAVVNIYSAAHSSNGMEVSDETETEDTNWAENLEVVKGLKGSYNSGKILINPVVTEDIEKDGKIEVEKIELKFDSEAARFFNEESRASILTAWGVMADLFAVTKPEKNNLRSQGEFLQIGLLLLKEKVAEYQQAICRKIKEILKYYGITSLDVKIQSSNQSTFLLALKEFAKEYMDFDEVREKLLGLERREVIEQGQIIEE
jgi:hypothetical protein